MKILGVDVETTGLSAAEDRITEVGAVLFDWSSQTPLVILSALVHPGRSIPEEIVKLTGITDEMVDDYGRAEEDVFGDLHYLLGCADYAMAHNAPFDEGFVNAAIARNGLSAVDKLWLCTKNDIKWPESITTRTLTYLAAECSIINPFRHRAIFDVLTMLKVAGGYDIDQIIARAKEPLLYVQAIVSFDEKEKAKELGFHWFAPGKQWWKPMKTSDFEAMKPTCGFQTRLLAGPLE
jgi:DNA polymerase III alpha subunit (gram-positive type)